MAERYFVAVMLTGKPAGGLPEKVAPLLGMDAYNARLLLSGEMPRIVAQFPENEQATKLSRKLRGLGLDAINGAASALLPVSAPVFMARAMQAGKGRVIFLNSLKEAKQIDADDAFLLLEGLLPHAEPEPQKQQPEKKLNVAATLLMGGIPVWSKRPPSPVPMHDESERFLRIYGRSSPEPAIEIRSGEFDYSSLGDKKGLSSTVNFKTLVAELRSNFPQAVYDDRLTRADLADGAATPQEALERGSHLIYLLNAARKDASES